MSFWDGATAGHATITNNGLLLFAGMSSAGTAGITNNGTLDFRDSASAAGATVTNAATGVIRAQYADVNIGSLAGGGSLTLGNRTVTIGARGTTTTFSGTISGSGGSLTKTGIGTLTLTAANSYSGTTTIAQGRLALAGTVTVGTGFTLDLANSGTSVFEITSPLYSPGTFDLVNGGGNVILGGVLSLVFTNGPYSNGTDVLQLFANSGSLTGAFSSVQVNGLADGQSVTFNAATGYVTIVPEPSGCVAAALGLSTLWLIRRRRQAWSTALPEGPGGSPGGGHEVRPPQNGTSSFPAAARASLGSMASPGPS